MSKLVPLDEVKNLPELKSKMLATIRLQLKAPLSAVLGDDTLLTVTEEDGIYSISGFVSSQNGYGALISNDFTCKAVLNEDGSWSVNSATVGVEAAKQGAKTFATNYIAISIFTGVMGLLGYFILSAIVGL